jgi:hypothetical protein
VKPSPFGRGLGEGLMADEDQSHKYSERWIRSANSSLAQLVQN